MTEAMLAEAKRLKTIIAKEDYKNHAYIHYSYKSRGLYFGQIKRYLNYFPMDKMLVVNSEALFDEPENALRRVFDFVGIDAELKIDNLKPHNVAINKTTIDPAVHEYLNHYFYAHNQALYKLVGEDYGW